jgi:hypothetical protein
MTATINASTSAGVVVTSDTSGSLALQTANTTAMTINSSQVVNFASTPTIGGSAFPSGAMTLISTQNLASQTQVAWTGLSGYDKYQLIINCSAKSGSQFVINLGYGSTPTYLTSNYNYRLVYYNGSSLATFLASGNNNFSLDYIGTGDGTNFGYENQSIIFTGTNSTTNVSAQGISYQSNTSSSYTTVNTFGGNVLTSASITAFKISSLGGYFTGTASLYGISS